MTVIRYSKSHEPQCGREQIESPVNRRSSPRRGFHCPPILPLRFDTTVGLHTIPCKCDVCAARMSESAVGSTNQRRRQLPRLRAFGESADFRTCSIESWRPGCSRPRDYWRIYHHSPATKRNLPHISCSRSEILQNIRPSPTHRGRGDVAAFLPKSSHYGFIQVAANPAFMYHGQLGTTYHNKHTQHVYPTTVYEAHIC